MDYEDTSKLTNPHVKLLFKLFAKQKALRTMIKELRKENHSILQDPRIKKTIDIEEFLDRL